MNKDCVNYLMTNLTPNEVVSVIRSYLFIAGKGKVVETLKIFEKQHPELMDWLKMSIDVKDKNSEYHQLKCDLSKAKEHEKRCVQLYKDLQEKFSLPTYNLAEEK